MTQEQIDLINKVVWFIPFKKKRNDVRNFLHMIIESINMIYEQNKHITNLAEHAINQNQQITSLAQHTINQNQQIIDQNQQIIDQNINMKYINEMYFSIKLKNIKSNTKKILFITHDYTISGAPLAVFHTANALQKKGYEVKVIGFNGGDLFEKYKENMIEAFIVNDFMNMDAALLNFLYYFDFIFANTIISCNFINKINGKIPYLWRIAEGRDIDKLFIKIFPNLYEILSKANNLYAVSKYAQKFLLKFNSNTKILIYGIEDVSTKYDKYKKYDDKIRFCNIASLYEDRKGQDIIFQAIELLDKDILDKTEFIFIGSIGLKNKFQYDNIKILGVKKNFEKYDVLSKCDILLHPALDDPNPQVVMEGMMMHKPCIITENVGQKDYIENGVSGFIIESGNAQALANLIKYIVQNINILEDMSEKSYKVYKKYFDINVYIDNVVSIIEDNLKSDE